MEYTTYYYDGGYQIFTPKLINNIKSAKLRYFDKKGNLEHQEDLHGVSNTEYFYSYDDTVAYNYKGKVVGEFHPFGNILSPSSIKKNVN